MFSTARVLPIALPPVDGFSYVLSERLNFCLPKRKLRLDVSGRVQVCSHAMFALQGNLGVSFGPSWALGAAQRHQLQCQPQRLPPICHLKPVWPKKKRTQRKRMLYESFEIAFWQTAIYGVSRASRWIEPPREINSPLGPQTSAFSVRCGWFCEQLRTIFGSLGGFFGLWGEFPPLSDVQIGDWPEIEGFSDVVQLCRPAGEDPVGGRERGGACFLTPRRRGRASGAVFPPPRNGRRRRREEAG